MSIPSVNELIDLGKRIVSKVKEIGADELEIYISASNRFSLRIITNYITTTSGLDAGVGIRAVVGKRVGFSSVSSLDYANVLNAAKMAVKIAKTRPEDPDFKHLPDPTRGAGGKGIFDEELASISINDLVNLSGKAVKAGLKYSEHIKKVDFSLNRIIGAFAVVNTRGIENGDRFTVLSSWTTVKAEKNGELATGIEFVINRKYVPEDVQELSVKAGQRAEKMFGGKKLERQIKGQLVIDSSVVEDFLWPLVFNVSALNVQNGRSKFIGKINEKVACEKVTIIDDGTLPEGIRTAKIDEEGIPTTRKSIIENGVLKTFIYDSYTAYKENRESTGNAFRRGYETAPSPSASNIIIKETNSMGVEDLVREVDRGVLIAGFTMGSHLTDPLKGSFSITSLNAFYVENGDIKYPLKSVSASGNFFELLNNVIKIGNDYRLTLFGKIPSMLVDGVTFI